MRNSN